MAGRGGLWLTGLMVTAVVAVSGGCGSTGVNEPLAGVSPATSATAPSPPARSAATSAGDRAVGDMPPSHVDNRGWRSRRELPPDARRAGEEAAARIRSTLDELRADGAFTRQAVVEALVGLGYRQDQVAAVELASEGHLTGPDIVPLIGVRVGVQLASGACVTGSVRPMGVMLEVAGPLPGGEGPCLEPFSH